MHSRVVNRSPAIPPLPPAFLHDSDNTLEQAYFLLIARFSTSNDLHVVNNIQGTVHPKIKMRTFPLTRSVIYPSRLIWFEMQCSGDIGY